MAKKTQTEDAPAESAVVAAAKTIGKAAGKMVTVVAGAREAEDSRNDQEQQAPKISSKVPKLVKKNKSRLPRREKKARQKAGTI